LSFILYGLRQYKRNHTNENYFLGGKKISWKKSMFSIVATETSLLTFMSLPGIGYRGENLFFLQLAMGYIVGRFMSAYLLIPMYYKSNIISIYELIGNSFGKFIQRIAAFIFLITRLLADGVRFLLTAIVIQQILGISIELCIVIIGVATLFYSILGGVKTIINIDSVQFFIYIFGGFFSVFYLLYSLDLNLFSTLISFFNQDILKLSTTSSSFIYDSYFFLNAFIGGVLLSFCSHGVDYMMVQRAMCTKTLNDAQKSITGSGFLVFFQFILFLFIGYLLSDFYNYKSITFQKDREFAHFIINDLPVGIKGLLIAGVLSAAMSTLSSSINSLSSSTIIDFKINFGKNTKFIIGFFWSIMLVGAALIFDESNEALIITGIKIASFTYGILLSFFILAKLNMKFSKFSIIIGTFLGFLSVFISSSNNIAWTLLIFICVFVNIFFTSMIHILETRISKKLNFGIFFITLQILSILFISKYMFPGPTSYGIDIFFKKHIDLVHKKNIGVLAIKSSVDKNGNHLVDLLIKEKNTNLIKIFSPEHGFYSDVANGEIVNDSNYFDIDIVSLYGNNRKPLDKDLKNIDILIIDIQDVGSSYYTYLSTVTYMLEAAEKNGISVILLDRPNPLGMLVYGPIRDNFSFIGLHPIPIRHGMTIGELSTMINEEGWLNNNIKVSNLKVIKMKKIPKTNQFYEWIPPSPNIPNKATAFLYNGICLFEGTNISEGRGTNQPFRLIGAPWINSKKLIDYIKEIKKTKYGNKLIVKESQFIPLSSKGAKNPKYENQVCNGIFIEYLDLSIEPIDLVIDLLSYFHNNYDQFLFKDNFFDKLYGNSNLRNSIIKREDLNKLRKSIDNDVIKFKEYRKSYLMYKQKHKQ
jgi:solute:Na+ symporter, SSS family